MANFSIDHFEKLIREISLRNKLYIFGAGIYGKMFGTFFNQCNIKWSGYIDNNEKLYSSNICDKKVYSLNDICDRKAIVVLISLSFLYYSEELDIIKKQLINSGIKEESILYFGDCYELRNELLRFINKAEEGLKRNKKLRNIFDGKRCFVIGNGPSLRIEDLEKLSNEISMGCNGIIDLTYKTKWRPTCFFCEDHIFVNNHINSLNELESILKRSEYVFTTLKTDLYRKYGLAYDNLFYLRSDLLPYELKFSEDISDRIFSSGTTLYSMFQVAVYMGIKEIYLLGVDFSFTKERYRDGTVKVNSYVKNHMEMLEQHKEGIYNVDLIMEGFKCFNNFANNHGIKIYNATRGGKLEIFNRVDFDSLFN